MLVNSVAETISAGGTGNLTLSGAVDSAHMTFNTSLGTNKRFIYKAKDGNNYEIGIGYLSASTTLVREKVLETFSSGTLDRSSPAALSLSTSTEVSISDVGQNLLQASNIDPFPDAGGIVGIGPGFQVKTNVGYGINTGFLFAIEFDLLDPMYVTECSCYVSTAVASGALRVGIGQWAANGRPGILLKEFTDTATIDASTTGVKTATPAAGLYLSAGLYCMFFASNNTTIQIKGPQYSPIARHMGTTSAGIENFSCYKSFTFGALPTSDQSGSAWTEDARYPKFHLA